MNKCAYQKFAVTTDLFTVHVSRTSLLYHQLGIRYYH